MSEQSWRDKIAEMLMRRFQRSQEEQAANNIPPLTGAMYPPEARQRMMGGAPGSAQFAADEAASMARKMAGGGNGPSGPGWGGPPMASYENAAGVPAPSGMGGPPMGRWNSYADGSAAPGTAQFAADEAASIARKMAGGGNGPSGPGWGGPQTYYPIDPNDPNSPPKPSGF